MLLERVPDQIRCGVRRGDWIQESLRALPTAGFGVVFKLTGQRFSFRQMLFD